MFVSLRTLEITNSYRLHRNTTDNIQKKVSTKSVSRHVAHKPVNPTSCRSIVRSFQINNSNRIKLDIGPKREFVFSSPPFC